MDEQTVDGPALERSMQLAKMLMTEKESLSPIDRALLQNYCDYTSGYSSKPPSSQAISLLEGLVGGEIVTGQWLPLRHNNRRKGDEGSAGFDSRSMQWFEGLKLCLEQKAGNRKLSATERQHVRAFLALARHGHNKGSLQFTRRRLLDLYLPDWYSSAERVHFAQRLFIDSSWGLDPTEGLTATRLLGFEGYSGSPTERERQVLDHRFPEWRSASVSRSAKALLRKAQFLHDLADCSGTEHPLEPCTRSDAQYKALAELLIAYIDAVRWARAFTSEQPEAPASFDPMTMMDPDTVIVVDALLPGWRNLGDDPIVDRCSDLMLRSSLGAERVLVVVEAMRASLPGDEAAALNRTRIIRESAKKSRHRVEKYADQACRGFLRAVLRSVTPQGRLRLIGSQRPGLSEVLMHHAVQETVARAPGVPAGF